MHRAKMCTVVCGQVESRFCIKLGTHILYNNDSVKITEVVET